MSLLELEGVSAGYTEVNIVNGLSLNVGSSEIVTIAGTNGSGKSTLVKAVMGLVPRCSGRFVFDGRDLLRIRAEDRVRVGISYVPQVANVFPTLSVQENLQVMEGVEGRAQRIREMFELFPILGERRGIRAGQLSGGERQRLALARALMTKPKLIVLDEPTASLAPNITAEVFSLVASLRKMQVAVLLVEQRARQSLEISDRGYILDGGRVVMEGAAADLLANGQMAQLYLGRH